MTDILQDWAKDDITILLRDKFKCVYCGLDGSKNVNAFRQLVLCFDHLVPRSRNGGEGIENRVTCCWACNRAKSDWDPRDSSADEAISDCDDLREEMIKRVQNHLKGEKKDELSDYFAKCLSALKELGGREVIGNLAHIRAELERTSAGPMLSNHDAVKASLDRMTAVNQDLVQTRAKTIDDAMLFNVDGSPHGKSA